MTDARNCPECFKGIAPGKSSCPCGWVDMTTDPVNHVRDRDPFLHCCEYLDRGLRCANLGSISPSTHGTTDAKGKTRSGPWYCPEHIDVVRGSRNYGDGKAPPPGGFRAMRQILRKEFSDPEAIAERAALQADD